MDQSIEYLGTPVGQISLMYPIINTVVETFGGFPFRKVNLEIADYVKEIIREHEQSRQNGNPRCINQLLFLQEVFRSMNEICPMIIVSAPAADTKKDLGMLSTCHTVLIRITNFQQYHYLRCKTVSHSFLHSGTSLTNSWRAWTKPNQAQPCTANSVDLILSTGLLIFCWLGQRRPAHPSIGAFSF